MIKIKQSERSTKSKENLIDTALELFSLQGYTGTTIKDIAKKAGVTDGLIYHYFSSKEELLQAVLASHNFLEEVRQILQFHDALPVDQKLYKLGSRLLELMVDKSSFITLVFGEAQRNEMMADKLEKLINGGVTALGGFLDQRAQDGEIKNIEQYLFARHFIGSLFLYFITYGKSRTKEEHQLYLKTVIEALCKGIINS